MKVSSFLRFSVVIAALISLTATTAQDESSTSAFELKETFSTKVLVDTTNPQVTTCTLIKSVAKTQLHRGVQSADQVVELETIRQNRINLKEVQKFNKENEKKQFFLEIFGANKETVLKKLAQRCPFGIHQENKPPKVNNNNTSRLLQTRVTPLVKKIVDSGDPKNRIDVVFMGDGYTAVEQDKFFNDMVRIKNEMFEGGTFAQYLPLFNIWAVFVPSKQSGIGVEGTPKDTAFGLYREGKELRGIYSTNTAYMRSVCESVGQYACDFPSLIANDDFYGGLGGEFTVGTRSLTSGTIVLRHEMGHSFGQVGEEYDGDIAYSGANTAPSLDQIPWKHWLTNPNKIREEKMALTYTDYMWYDLKEGPFESEFTATGEYSRWMMVVSASGMDTSDSFSITLDGKPLKWETRGHKDRVFYTWNSNNGLRAGQHKIVVKGGGNFSGPILKQLCSIDLTEYKGEDEFKMSDDVISAYPTWDGYGEKHYRPSNERCLMRNMVSTHFCSVCKENLWLKFMERVQFIDGLVIKGSKAELKLIPLGQLRKDRNGVTGEKYVVSWFKDGKEQPSLKDKFAVDVSSGKWKVVVTFQTPSVRYDPKKLLQSERRFQIATTKAPVTQPPVWGSCLNKYENGVYFVSLCASGSSCVIQSKYYAQCMPLLLGYDQLCGQDKAHEGMKWQVPCGGNMTCRARRHGDTDLRCL